VIKHTLEKGDFGVRQYSANLITEYMQSRMDPEVVQPEVVQHDVFCEVVDHHKSTAKDKPDAWSFCVKWADGSTSWLPYMQIWVSNPVELATYKPVNLIGPGVSFRHLGAGYLGAEGENCCGCEEEQAEVLADYA
jgi:hypothetical protein